MNKPMDHDAADRAYGKAVEALGELVAESVKFRSVAVEKLVAANADAAVGPLERQFAATGVRAANRYVAAAAGALLALTGPQKA